RRTRERAMQILIYLGDDIWRPEEEVDRLQWSAAVMEKVLPLFKIEDPTSINVVSLEERFDDVEVGGVPFIGFIDRVEEAEDGTITVSDYKGLALETAIPTPTGWTTMGDLRKGDKVLGSDGNSATVTAKSGTHNRPCYELVFSDGSKVISDNVHLWTITESRRNGRPETY